MKAQYYCYGYSINTTDLPVLKVHVTDFPVVKVHLTDFPVLKVYVAELSSARISQHKLCATLSANVNINYRLLMKVYYLICTVRHIRIEIIHGSQNMSWVWTLVGRLFVHFPFRYSSGLNTNIRQPMLKLKTHFAFHDLFKKKIIFDNKINFNKIYYI